MHGACRAVGRGNRLGREQAAREASHAPGVGVGMQAGRVLPHARWANPRRIPA